MPITKKTITDQIEIVGIHRHVQVREATIIEEDGVEISQTYHRYVIAPDDDHSDKDDLVKSICKAVHTAKVKQAYAKEKAKAQLPHA
jgi:hypothetical protein